MSGARLGGLLRGIEVERAERVRGPAACTLWNRRLGGGSGGRARGGLLLLALDVQVAAILRGERLRVEFPELLLAHSAHVREALEWNQTLGTRSTSVSLSSGGALPTAYGESGPR